MDQTNTRQNKLKLFLLYLTIISIRLYQPTVTIAINVIYTHTEWTSKFEDNFNNLDMLGTFINGWRDLH